jgi:hypothetical protein
MTIHIAAADDIQPPDKKIASKKVTGRLLDAQQGDYFHASVRTERGNKESFFVDDDICFLALNKKEVLVIEYDEITRYFPEGRGYYPANIIQSISTRAGQNRWVRNQSASPNLTQWRECASDLLTLSDDRHGQ